MTAAPLELVALAAQHAHDLRRMVGDPLVPTVSASASKAVMLAALQAAELDLLQTLTLLPPAVYDRQPVCGVWTAHDLIGHLADWDSYFLDWLGDLCGEPHPERHWDDDGDRFNAWLLQRRHGEPWGQTWADLRANRRSLHQRLAAVPEDLFLREHDDRPFPTVYHCAWSALEHYLDHAAGVRRRLGAPLADALLHFRGPYTD